MAADCSAQIIDTAEAPHGVALISPPPAPLPVLIAAYEAAQAADLQQDDDASSEAVNRAWRALTDYQPSGPGDEVEWATWMTREAKGLELAGPAAEDISRRVAAIANRGAGDAQPDSFDAILGRHAGLESEREFDALGNFSAEYDRRAKAAEDALILARSPTIYGAMYKLAQAEPFSGHFPHLPLAKLICEDPTSSSDHRLIASVMLDLAGLAPPIPPMAAPVSISPPADDTAILAACAEHAEACALDDAISDTGAEDLPYQNELAIRQQRLEALVAGTPARTSAGVRAKAEMFARIHNPVHDATNVADPSHGLPYSIVCDLLGGTTVEPQPAADAELLALEVEWDRLAAEESANEDAIEALTDQAVYPPLPDALHWRADDAQISGRRMKVGAPMRRGDIEYWRRDATADLSRRMTPRLAKAYAQRAQEIVAADDAHQAAWAKVRDDIGLTALTDRDADITDQQSVVELQAAAIRATTKAGMAFKAKVARRYATNLNPDEDYGDRFLKSLLDDLAPEATPVAQP